MSDAGNTSGARQNHPSPRRIVFMANCVYGDHVGGGDIHFFHMARAALDAGFELHFFGGHALKGHLEKRRINASQTLTDNKQMRPINSETLPGQARLFFNYLGRFLRALAQRSQIRREDTAYAVTDYWFDVWPVVFSRAARKVMILGMDAPTLREIVFRTRADVTAVRLNSIYYWLSQNLSLRLFRRCKTKRLLYVHPGMKARLLRLGYAEQELAYVSNGCNVEVADSVPAQKKEFDAAWLGRVHRQKGIEDLLETLRYLRGQIPGFRVVLAGQAEAALRPRVRELGLEACVHFSGFVSEEKKFRLFKASRVFLMPSRQESWGIVIAEALACGVPVVAYDLEAYRPVFGNLVRYVSRFDLPAFQSEAAALINQARAGNDGLDSKALAGFKKENSWTAAGERFTAALKGLLEQR